METASFMMGVISFIITMIGVIPLLYSYLSWRRQKRLDRFHRSITPVLHELEGFSWNLTPEQRRRLVREFAKQTSLACFNSEQPVPDPSSLRYSSQIRRCRICKLKVKCDEQGGCEDCGLGARHWAQPGARERGGSARRRGG